MFSKPSKPAAADAKSNQAKRGNGSSVPTLIAKDTHIVGNISSDGVMDIDGRIEGNVHCGVATVRRNGHIKGDLIADSVFIHGRVQGLIRARSVNFFNGCRVEGVIHHEAIAIEDGAFVDGRFKRSDSSRPSEDEESKEPAVFPLEKVSHPFGRIGGSTPFFDTESELDKEDKAEEENSSPREGGQSRMLDKLKLIGDA